MTTRFGTYRLHERLAAGSVSEVWRATDEAHDVVALKRFTDFGHSELRFLQEQSRLLQLLHPNLAQYLDVGVVEGQLFIAMEYVRGKSLDSTLRHCRKTGDALPIALGAFLIAQAGRGLDFAHRFEDSAGRRLGFVHRGLELEHVLIGYEGHVKLIGWTDAQLPDRSERIAKVAHMSPELLKDLPVDRRGDVFQLGACLYEVLTGTRPYRGETDMAAMLKLRDGVISTPRVFNPMIPEALEAVVLKALATQVDDRYQHASDLVDALKPFSANATDLADFMRRTTDEPSDLLRQLEQKWGD